MVNAWHEQGPGPLDAPAAEMDGDYVDVDGDGVLSEQDFSAVAGYLNEQTDWSASLAAWSSTGAASGTAYASGSGSGSGSGSSSGSACASVTINAPSPGVVSEGGQVSLSGMALGYVWGVYLDFRFADGSLAPGVNSMTYLPVSPNSPWSYTVSVWDDAPAGTSSDVLTVTAYPSGACSPSTPATASVTVNNVPPTLALTGPATAINEGQSASVTITGTDVSSYDGMTGTIAWGDGTAESFTLGSSPYSGGGGSVVSVTKPHTYLDDPADNPNDEYTVVVTLDDGDGGMVTQSVPVTVNDLPPTIELDPIQPIHEGDPLTVVGRVTDVGILDVPTVTLLMDLNFDGDVLDDAETIAANVQPVYGYGPGQWWFEYHSPVVPDDGATYDQAGNRVWGNDTTSDPLTIDAEADDGDGGAGIAQCEVVVRNVPPEFVDGPYFTFVLNEDHEPTGVTIDGVLEDVGAGDNHRLYVNWGDGVSGDGSGSAGDFVVIGPGAFSVTRPFSSPEDEDVLFPVQVRLDDDDSGSVSQDLFLCDCGGIACGSGEAAPESQPAAAGQMAAAAEGDAGFGLELAPQKDTNSGKWGDFGYGINWRLKTPAPATGGWIIQHVTVTFNITVPPGGTHPLDDGRWDYWEAWRVEPGATASLQKKSAGAAYDDTFQMPSVGIGTCGSVLFKAEAKFYPIAEADLPAAFRANNPDLALPNGGPNRAGVLRATRDANVAAQLTSDGGTTVARTVRAKWSNGGVRPNRPIPASWGDTRLYPR